MKHTKLVTTSRDVKLGEFTRSINVEHNKDESVQDSIDTVTSLMLSSMNEQEISLDVIPDLTLKTMSIANQVISERNMGSVKKHVVIRTLYQVVDHYLDGVQKDMAQLLIDIVVPQLIDMLASKNTYDTAKKKEQQVDRSIGCLKLLLQSNCKLNIPGLHEKADEDISKKITELKSLRNA